MDGVGWKRFGQLQVTCLPCFRSAEVLIIKATVCKLPAVFRYAVDELFQNASGALKVISIRVKHTC